MTAATVREVFREQARSCAKMGSPFTARVCALVADRMQAGGAVADRILGWPGDASYQGATVALRLAGGLHGLVLEGAAPGLAAVYPPHESDDAALWTGRFPLRSPSTAATCSPASTARRRPTSRSAAPPSARAS